MSTGEKSIYDLGSGAIGILEAEIAALESQLGAAHERIAILEAALRMAAGMKTIRRARRIVGDTLGEEKE